MYKFKTCLKNINKNPTSFATKYNSIRSYNNNINQILDRKGVGDKIELKGWIKSVRKQKQNVFVDISDGSTDKKLQVVVRADLAPKNLSLGASVLVRGNLNLSPRGHLELNAENVSIYGEAVVGEGFDPISPKKTYDADYLRRFPHLRQRNDAFASVLRVRSAAALAFHNYLDSEGYFNVHTPALTRNDCEGAGEAFKVLPNSLTTTHKSTVTDDKSINKSDSLSNKRLTVSDRSSVSEKTVESDVSNLNKNLGILTVSDSSNVIEKTIEGDLGPTLVKNSRNLTVDSCGKTIEGDLSPILIKNLKSLTVNDSNRTIETERNDAADKAFFDAKTFLSVSGQLHLEAMCRGLSKVYALGPTFRAENSRTRFHLSEFYMLEAEIAFLDTPSDLTDAIEDLVKSVTRSLLDRCEGDILNANKDGESRVDFGWLDKPFSVIPYDEAADILKANGSKLKERFDEEHGDFCKEHETFLVDHCGNVPTFVVEWPKRLKPFYMKEVNGCADKVSALDLLVPKVGELVGGSLREDDYEKLKDRLPSDSQLDWYLELRKFGNVPTGGYGLGFDRYLLWILGVNNIRDVLPFPRWPHNCKM